MLLTAGHEVAAGDANGAVLADADLAILGADADRYARYAADVRAEYAHVADDAWRAGRSAVLRRFLDRPRLYVTDRAHAALDASARRNLAAELARRWAGLRPQRLRPAGRRTSSRLSTASAPRRDRLLPPLLGDVVVVALEQPGIDAEAGGERVQLGEGRRR